MRGRWYLDGFVNIRVYRMKNDAAVQVAASFFAVRLAAHVFCSAARQNDSSYKKYSMCIGKPVRSVCYASSFSLVISSDNNSVLDSLK